MLMPHIVLEACIGCLYTDCVDVCPVECFHEDEKMLVIDPYECIDCALCIPECPVDAIVDADDAPENMKHYIQINADRAPKTPVLAESRPREK
jgi:ferredoxin